MTGEDNHPNETGCFARKECDPRPLHIDFDAYTEGDNDYKRELMGLIAQNLEEFQQCLLDPQGPDTPVLFLNGAHKAKVILSMLEDEELSRVVEALEKDIVKDAGDPLFTANAARFHEICDSVIKALQIEINKS